MDDEKYFPTYRKLGIGENCFTLKFSDFHNQDVVKLCKNFIDNFPTFCNNGMGLMFAGVPGSGKTMLASLILMELVKKYNVVGSCLDMEQVLHLISNQWKDDERKEEINRKLFLAPILLLDNVPFVLTKSKDVNETLYLILSRRLKINRPTLITTCLTDAEMSFKFSKEVISVMTESTCRVNLPPVDYRLKHPKHKMLQSLLFEGITPDAKK